MLPLINVKLLCWLFMLVFCCLLQT